MNRWWRVTLWLVAGHGAVLALYAVGVLTKPVRYPDGQCAGIAGACTGGPRVDALLSFIFVVLPTVTVSLLVCLALVGVAAAVCALHKARTPPG